MWLDQNADGVYNVFDLGIRYNTVAFRKIFCGHSLAKDAPPECRAICAQSGCQHTIECGAHTLWTYVRWGSAGRSYEFVGILFGENGTLNLIVGYKHRNSKYSPAAVVEISLQVDLMLNVLRRFEIIDNLEVKK